MRLKSREKTFLIINLCSSAKMQADIGMQGKVTELTAVGSVKMTPTFVTQAAENSITSTGAVTPVCAHTC